MIPEDEREQDKEGEKEKTGEREAGEGGIETKQKPTGTKGVVKRRKYGTTKPRWNWGRKNAGRSQERRNQERNWVKSRNKKDDERWRRE